MKPNRLRSITACALLIFALQGRIFQIEDMQAFDETPHVSSSPAQYALELPRGSFEKRGIAAGSMMKIGPCEE